MGVRRRSVTARCFGVMLFGLTTWGGAVAHAQVAIESGWNPRLSFRPAQAETSVAGAKPDPHRIHLAVGAFMAASAADTAVTFHLLSKHQGNFREANPVLGPLEDRPASLAVVKTGIAAVVSYVLIRNHKEHPQLTFWIAVGGAAANTAAACYAWRQNP